MPQVTLLKGLAQGYILTAPAMVVMRLVGQEGTLGVVLSLGGILRAFILYAAGHLAAARHRNRILGAGLLLFFAGAAANALLFNAPGVFLFAACLMLAKPLLDLGYNPIELRVIEAVQSMERRDGYAYLFNHELALFVGRACGCLLFLVVAWRISTMAALRYSLPTIATLQLLSIPLAARVLREADAASAEAAEPAPPLSRSSIPE